MLAGADVALASKAPNDWQRSKIGTMAKEIRDGSRDGGPSEDEIEILTLALVAAFAPTSNYFGTVGERVKVRAVYEGGPFFETEYGRKHLARFRMSTGEILVWGTTAFGSFTEHKGETLEIIATVVKHTEYKGESQTFINRAKVTK